jgi:hypothetical protein
LATIKKTVTNAGEDIRKKSPSYTADGNINSATTMEISMEVSKKPKLDLNL